MSLSQACAPKAMPAPSCMKVLMMPVAVREGRARRERRYWYIEVDAVNRFASPANCENDECEGLCSIFFETSGKSFAHATVYWSGQSEQILSEQIFGAHFHRHHEDMMMNRFRT